jgi:orotidine-5'-phosphate decarboxylase
MLDHPIICAVDTSNVSQAHTLAETLGGSVGALKLGLEFFTANGAAGVKQISDRNIPIFLDLKFHDIPNTVAKAIKATAGIDTFMLTVHASGGQAMLRAAIDASMEVAATTGKARPMIIGVTILTSLDQDDLELLGMRDMLTDQVRRMADLAQDSGLDGVVCSPHEITLIREHCGDDFTLVVPGIRPAGSETGDQKRVLSPKEALEKGADYLVIGRPITGAPDPKAAADAIYKSLERIRAA